MRIVTAGLSKAGGRKSNQDSFGAEPGDNGGCWVVADGLGGHAGGETASRMAVETVLQRCRQAATAPAELIGDCFRDAQKAIVQKAAANYELAGMRTTDAVPTMPLSRTTLTRTVGKPRESRISMAVMVSMRAVMTVLQGK